MKKPDNLKIEYLPVSDLEPYEKNARKHDVGDVQTIINSIKKFGFNDPIGIWSNHNVIVEGHGRLMAAKQLGMTEVPCIRLDNLTDAERRAYALAHNRTAELSAWDNELLDLELDELVLEDIDMSELGFDNAESNTDTQSDIDHHKMLEKRFLVPPFSILDARQGYWVERKRAWKEIIGDAGQAREQVNVITYEARGGGMLTCRSLIKQAFSTLFCRKLYANGLHRATIHNALMCLQETQCLDMCPGILDIRSQELN